MMSPACGSIWMPIIRTMKSLRPVKRYFASAIAARNARAIEMATVVQTMIRLFFTSVQKNGVWIAVRKWAIVGRSENHVGLALMIWSSGLKAVEIIQKTGNTMTTNRTTATAFQPALAVRRRFI